MGILAGTYRVLWLIVWVRYSNASVFNDVTQRLAMSPTSYRSTPESRGGVTQIGIIPGSMGDSVIPLLLASRPSMGTPLPMAVSVSKVETIFGPVYRKVRDDSNSIESVSESNWLHGSTHTDLLKLKCSGSVDFMFESPFTIVSRRASYGRGNKFVGMMDMSMTSPFIQAAGGKYVLAMISETISLRIGDIEDDTGFVYTPVIPHTNAFVIRGTINEVLRANIIFDSLSESKLIVPSFLVSLFSEPPAVIRLTICGHTIRFPKYSVTKDDFTVGLTVIVNPTSFRNFEILFDATATTTDSGGRIGLRKVWPQQSV